MKTRLWILLALVAVVVGGVAVLPRHDRAREPVGAAAAEPLPSVTVRHDLIVVPASPERAAVAVRPVRAAMPVRHAAAAPPSAARVWRTPAAERGLFGRARRAVVGDGRYRPEPFPRLKGN